jgi:hypothetical protein
MSLPKKQQTLYFTDKSLEKFVEIIHAFSTSCTYRVQRQPDHSFVQVQLHYEICICSFTLSFSLHAEQTQIYLFMSTISLGIDSHSFDKVTISQLPIRSPSIKSLF